MRLLLIPLVVGLTYAVNTWKIRLVTRGRAVAAAAMEGLQGFLYVFVLVAILEGSDTLIGAGAYMIGAFAGTITAMLLSRRELQAIPPHHHTCCPPFPAASAVGSASQGFISDERRSD